MASKSRTKTEKVLDAFAKRLAKCRRLREGSIGIHVSGKGGGNYVIECRPGAADVTRASRRGPHQLEVMGSATKVRNLISGERDAVAVFLTGGVRIRGDLRYASDLALELGLIDQPL